MSVYVHSEDTAKKRSNSRDVGVDILKAIAAFLVVVIHSHTQLSHINETLDVALVAVSRLGVGCFFIITGFYYPVLLNRGKLKGHIEKIFKLAFYSVLLYIAFNIVFYTVVWHSPMLYLTNFTDLDLWYRFIVFNNCRADAHIWYLFAIAYTILFCLLFDKLDKRKALYVSSLILFIVGLVIEYLSHTTMVRSWLFYGLPFVSAGIIIRDNMCYVLRIKLSILVICLIAGLTFTAIEATLFSINRDFFILSLLNAACALLIAIKAGNIPIIKQGGLSREIARIGLKYSVYIYTRWLNYKDKKS